MDTPTQNGWDGNRLGWLALAWFDGFGSRTLRKLRARYPNDGMAAFSASRSALLSVGITEFQTDKFCAWRPKIDPEALARRCDADGIRLVIPEDEEYPFLLAQSSDPPGALFVRGATLALKRPVAVVGTRSMTPYGAKAADRICRDLAIAGCEIVSGLALGIDARAHAACLDVGGTTVAVVAGGCNEAAIYPRSNAMLAKRILGNGGTIVAEFPPGTESMKHHFPIRNRIIASLSLATVVIEAAESSGSLITATLAITENRDVLSVPGPITSEQSSGTNRLLKMGAIPCTDATDVFEILDMDAAGSDVPSVDADADERGVLGIMDQPIHIDDIVRETRRSAAEISPILIAMELKGLVEAQGGNVYVRTKAGQRAAKPRDG